MLEEPARMAREDLVGLKSLAEKYPWFSGAQLLRTVGDRISGDVLFDETLRTTAAHLPSRSVLYDLVTTPPPPPVKLQVVKTQTAKTAPTSTASPIVMEEPMERAPSYPVIEIPDELAAPEAIEESPATEEPVVRASANGTDPLGEELEEQIMRSALAGAYDLTLREQLSAVEPPRAQGRRELSDQPIIPEPKPAHTVVPVNARLSFTDWLDQANAAPPITPVTAGVSTAVAPPMVDSNAAPAAPFERLDTAELLDRFIQQANPAPPPRPAFFAPQEAGKRSLDDTVGLVTETLARIYAKQGNLPKAIETYRRLALKYPEK
ncbi:MAG: hypothetical protein IPL52_10210, partial [Flavobacteriales bacterium]|nr:hypothetical protein [Flavobacteriales bacterium]